MNRPLRPWVLVASVLALAIGCDEESGLSQFACEDLEGDVAFCDDFSDGDSDGWSPEGGSWSVIDEHYLGSGPAAVDTSVCGASLMTASLRDGSESTDLAMHLELRSLARADKVVVLRASDASNRIELNFRGEPINDLVVQELVDCDFIFHVGEGAVPILQPEDEALEVDVELRANRLVVRAGGQTVLDRELALANTEGRVGVAVIESALTSFDSIWMRRL